MKKKQEGLWLRGCFFWNVFRNVFKPLNALEPEKSEVPKLLGMRQVLLKPLRRCPCGS